MSCSKENSLSSNDCSVDVSDPVLKRQSLLFSGNDFAGVVSHVLTKGHYFRFRARGISMTPFVKDGDVLTIAPLSSIPISLGDILLFVREDGGKKQSIVVHRNIGKIAPEKVVAKGDNISDMKRDVVALSDILGKVIQIERNGVPVTFGLGIERFAIAILSKYNLLAGLLYVPRLIRHIRRKDMK